jgi:hypothetical protein
MILVRLASEEEPANHSVDSLTLTNIRSTHAYGSPERRIATDAGSYGASFQINQKTPGAYTKKCWLGRRARQTLGFLP